MECEYLGYSIPNLSNLSKTLSESAPRSRRLRKQRADTRDLQLVHSVLSMLGKIFSRRHFEIFF